MRIDRRAAGMLEWRAQITQADGKTRRGRCYGNTPQDVAHDVVERLRMRRGDVAEVARADYGLVVGSWRMEIYRVAVIDGYIALQDAYGHELERYLADTIR